MLIRRQDKKAISILILAECFMWLRRLEVVLKSAQTNLNSLELTKQKKEQWKFWT